MINEECWGCGELSEVKDTPWMCIKCATVNELDIPSLISDLGVALAREEKLKEKLASAATRSDIGEFFQQLDRQFKLNREKVGL